MRFPEWWGVGNPLPPGGRFRGASEGSRSLPPECRQVRRKSRLRSKGAVFVVVVFRGFRGRRVVICGPLGGGTEYVRWGWRTVRVFRAGFRPTVWGFRRDIHNFPTLVAKLFVCRSWDKEVSFPTISIFLVSFKQWIRLLKTQKCFDPARCHSLLKILYLAEFGGKYRNCACVGTKST